MTDTIYCPSCGGSNVNIYVEDTEEDILHCSDCGFEWSVYDYDVDGIPDSEETKKDIEAHIEKHVKEIEALNKDEALADDEEYSEDEEYTEE